MLVTFLEFCSQVALRNRLVTATMRESTLDEAVDDHGADQDGYAGMQVPVNNAQALEGELVSDVSE